VAGNNEKIILASKIHKRDSDRNVVIFRPRACLNIGLDLQPYSRSKLDLNSKKVELE